MLRNVDTDFKRPLAMICPPLSRSARVVLYVGTPREHNRERNEPQDAVKYTLVALARSLVSTDLGKLSAMMSLLEPIGANTRGWPVGFCGSNGEDIIALHVHVLRSYLLFFSLSNYIK